MEDTRSVFINSEVGQAIGLTAESTMIEIAAAFSNIKNNGKLNFNPSNSSTQELNSGYYEGGTLSTSNAYTAGSHVPNFTKKNTAGYNGRDKVGTGTSIKLSGSQGLIVIGSSLSNHTCTIASGSCTLKTLGSLGIDDYGAYGAQAYVLVYQYSNNSSCTLNFNGSYGNNGSFVAFELTY